MNRRHFLAGGLALTPALTGCLTMTDGGRDPSGPTVAVAERDDPPDIPVRPTVEVVEPSSSDAGPAELRAAVENTADHPVEVGEERAIVFAFVHSESRPGLVLLPTASDYAPVEAGCWRLTEDVVIPEYYGVVGLDPGGIAERNLGVWATREADDCLPTGRYRFESRYAGARDRNADIEEPTWEATWGFTLEVE